MIGDKDEDSELACAKTLRRSGRAARRARAGGNMYWGGQQSRSSVQCRVTLRYLWWAGG